MEIRTAEEILKEILEGYNKKPDGWQIASDFRGNAIFLGPGKSFMVKTMMINPQENLGVGAMIEETEALRAALRLGVPSGFRPMGKDLAHRALSEFSLQREGQKRDLINRLLSIDPVPTWELDKEGIGGIVGGPYVSHPDLRMISKSQSELDQKLDLELKNLFMARHPLRASMFR